MKHPKLIHHGAREGVTGSCHQLWMDENSSVLIDCGQFQGDDEAGHEDELALDFSIEGVKALIVTHVHIDHIGRIPNLLAAGFDGPILCSEPSARLLPIGLEEAFRLSISRDQEQLERYLQVVGSSLGLAKCMSLLAAPQRLSGSVQMIVLVAVGANIAI